MNIYEMYGRKAEQCETLIGQFLATLDLLRQIHDGAVQPSQLVVTDKGWTLRDTEQGEEPPSLLRPLPKAVHEGESPS